MPGSYRIAEMFGRVKQKKFGKRMDVGHKDTISELKFGWLKFGKVQKIC